jgi:hypothetical protein
MMNSRGIPFLPIFERQLIRTCGQTRAVQVTSAIRDPAWASIHCFSPSYHHIRAILRAKGVLPGVHDSVVPTPLHHAETELSFFSFEGPLNPDGVSLN